MSSPHEAAVWERGWDGHETQQRQRLAKRALSEKLRWLEEAHHLVLHLSMASPQALPRDDEGDGTKRVTE